MIVEVKTVILSVMVLSVYGGNSWDNYTLKDTLVKEHKQKVSVLHNKGQKQQGLNRSRRDYEEVSRIHRKTVQQRS